MHALLPFPFSRRGLRFADRIKAQARYFVAGNDGLQVGQVKRCLSGVCGDQSACVLKQNLFTGLCERGTWNWSEHLGPFNVAFNAA